MGVHPAPPDEESGRRSLILHEEPMKKQYLLIFSLLVVLTLACSLNGSSLAAIPPTGSPTQTSPPTPMPTLPATATPAPPPGPAAALVVRSSCTVATGVENGSLTLRAGPGVRYPALAWLAEGSPAFPLLSPPAGSWQQVQVGALQGWVYSPYLECHP